MDLHTIVYPLSAILIFTLAFGLAIFLAHRTRLGWSLLLIGAGGFLLSQVGHIPFNALLSLLIQRGVLPGPAPQQRLIFNAVVGGLSAGLWEELVRYAVFRWWAKERRSWQRAVLLGAGWGGVEAILIGALALYAFAQMVGLKSADISKMVPPEQVAAVQQAVSSYWSAPWYLGFLSFVERVFAIASQIAFAVLVLQAFTRRQFFWVWLAVLWHAVMDATAVYLVGLYGALVTEAVVGVFALVNIGVIFALRTPEPAEVAVLEHPTPVALSAPLLASVEETQENLENTRYN